MKKIVAFGASSSRNSINRQFVSFAASQLKDVEVELLDLNDFEMPIYSIDREKENGIPKLAEEFKKHLASGDAIMISFAEHNGSYSTAFKNIYDWMSRIEKNVWLDKPMFALSTSPGGRGGANVMSTVSGYFPHAGANIISKFSLPRFTANFSPEEGILDGELRDSFEKELNNFQTFLDQM